MPPVPGIDKTSLDYYLIIHFMKSQKYSAVYLINNKSAGSYILKLQPISLLISWMKKTKNNKVVTFCY